MSFRAEFIPNVVRVTADAGELARLAVVLARQWGATDLYARATRLAADRDVPWTDDLDPALGEQLVMALEGEAWPLAAARVRCACKLALAEDHRQAADRLEAEARDEALALEAAA